MAPMTIEVSVMAAEELHNTSKLGKMSVYTVLWVDPAMKKCTRVLHKIGKNPVWNDRMSLTLVNGDQTLVSYPQSTLTVQVFSEGRIKDTLVGTTYISLVEIARMNAMSPDPEEGNIVTLPLHRPSRRIQGYIRLWVNLSDKGQGLLASEMPSSSLGTVEGIPVMSYAAQTHGMLPNSYHNTAPYPSSAIVGYQQGAGSVYHSQAPAAVAVPYYAPANTNGAPYVQPQAPYTSAFAPRPRGQRRGNFLLALISGAIGGLLLGDIIGGGF
ncbi:hypothetical protein CY35_03G014500 [Sphagnum magellanicum]|nr:hypothetical protein CY35_03G014500 [Sphagnum magellanicum]KAH9567122.1 hypothetical protein CY35_03G014500 [Sphagnum magellanicum]